MRRELARPFCRAFDSAKIKRWRQPITPIGPAVWAKVMYAVIKTGGKQYKVAAGGVVEVGKLAGAKGDSIAFEDVLMVGDGDAAVSLGSPLVAGASVAAEIVEQKRGGKILVFKKRRRQNSKRSRGHRQDFTLVRITEILTDGKKAKNTAAARPAEAKVETAAEAPAAEGEAAAKPKRAAPKAKAADAGAAEKPKAARKPRARPAKAEDKE